MKNDMENNWKYIGDREGEFSEAFQLNKDGNKIKVEVNRSKKHVKIYLETKDGAALESSITNGIVLGEKNCHTGRKENLLDDFTAIGRLLAGIPDSKVIRLIGENYGVLSAYTFRTSRYINEDIKLLKRFIKYLAGLPLLIGGGIFLFLKDLADQPKISDVIDAGIVVMGGYLTYLINYNFVFGGLALVVGALASGYFDWLVRKREPYILKVVLIIIPAFYVINMGLKYQ